MEKLAAKYKDKVEFLFIYCREAHAADSPQRNNTRTRAGKAINQARDMEEREETARLFCEEMKMARRILVDEFADGGAQRKYGGLPNPTVVIDVEGHIALKMAWTNGATLDRFLQPFLAKGGKYDQALAQAVPASRGPGGRAGQPDRGGPAPEMMARAAERMLEGLDLTEQEMAAARRAVVTKMELRGRARQKGIALEETARRKDAGEEDLVKAVKEFEAAVAEFRKAADDVDAKLRSQVSARAHAQLLAKGILENGIGFMGPGPAGGLGGIGPLGPGGPPGPGQRPGAPAAPGQPGQPPARPGQPGRRRPPGDLGLLWSQGRGEGRGPVELTHPPMRLEDIAGIIPMGLMVGAHVTPCDHLYFEPKDRDAGRYAYDVFAPADGHIVHIQHRDRLHGSTETERAYDDYRVVIEHSGTFWSYFDLITRLDPAVVKHMERVPVGGPPVHVRIPVKAGQVIGKVGGRTLDFAVVNSAVTLKGFLVPEHYGPESWKIHTVDPFEHFAEPVRGRLLALNPRTAEPRGGKIDHDIAGRAVGNWFREGTNGYAGANDPRGYWMGHLALVYHHIDPSQIVVSIGDWGGRPRQFFVKGNGPDPAKVSEESGLVKYELIHPGLDGRGRRVLYHDEPIHGVLLVQVLPQHRLKVEAVAGKRGAAVAGFTDQALIYER